MNRDSLKGIILKLIKLFTGLFLYAVGIVMSINANLGLAPWDIFHQGLSKTFNITMGQASIYVGIVLVILNSVFGERLGWGTLSNMYFIGKFVDFLMLNNLIPTAKTTFLGVIMMILGMAVISAATYLYIGAGLGSGPRDGLMIALSKMTKKSVRLIRGSIEVSVLIMGYLLGGFAGIGTLIMATTIGYFVQFTFKIFKFDVKGIKHRFIDEDIKYLKIL